MIYLEAGNLDTYQTKVAQGAKDFLGLLGTELGGSDGERALDAYTRFQDADAKLRSLAAGGQAEPGGGGQAGDGARVLRRLRPGAAEARRAA